MLTFDNLVTGAQELTGDSSTDSLPLLKRAINQGMQIFTNTSRRYFTRLSKKTDIVASQQYYQLPEDAVRVSGVVVLNSGISYPLEQITSEQQWRRLNAMVSGTINIPTYYFVRGKDEIGLWPTPSSNVTAGLEVFYEPRQVNLSQSDYSTGTITVTNGSTTITHSATGFSQNMIGRYFQVTDGTDGLWYRIASFTSTSVLLLENYYQGIGGSGKTFTIAEIPPIPEEFHESLIDYAAYRFFLARKDIQVANEYKNLFDAAVEMYKETYSAKTTGVIQEKTEQYGYNLFNIPPNPIV